MSSRIPRRGAVYYVQQAVPKSLQAVYGCKQIWKSLRTTDHEEAKGRLLDAKRAFRAEFKAAQDRLAVHAQPAAPQANESPFRSQEEEEDFMELAAWATNMLDERAAEIEADPLLKERHLLAVELRGQRERREMLAEIEADERAKAGPKPKGTRLGVVVDRWASYAKPSVSVLVCLSFGVRPASATASPQRAQ